MLKRPYGFTLIELLVVILIIGLVSGIIVLKTGSFYLSGKRSEVFARELTAMLGLARSQAIFSLDTIGLRMSGNEYRFLWLDNTPQGSSWKPLGDKDVFWRARPIPGDTIVTVSVQRSKPGSFLQDNTAPQIVIMPSGELTPFTISIHKTGSGQIFRITGKYGGKISMKEME